MRGAKRHLLIINVMRWPDTRQPRRFLQAFDTAAADHTIDHAIVRLHDIGEEALWWGDGVAMRIGHLSFGVSTLNMASTPQARQQIAEQLARLIAHRTKARSRAKP
jgi:hypothetical protein